MPGDEPIDHMQQLEDDHADDAASGTEAHEHHHFAKRRSYRRTL
jgi:hypothetical protein